MELVDWFVGWLDKVKEDDMNWACGMWWEERNTYSCSGGKTWRKERPLGRPLCRWENIKLNFPEVVWEDVDRINWLTTETSDRIFFWRW